MKIYSDSGGKRMAALLAPPERRPTGARGQMTPARSLTDRRHLRMVGIDGGRPEGRPYMVVLEGWSPVCDDRA